MITVIEKDNNRADMSLEGELTIYVADKFNQELNNYVNKYQGIDIDMSNVNELDTSCYQVLLRTKLLCLNANKAFNISNISDQAQQVFDLYNLGNVFSHPENNEH